MITIGKRPIDLGSMGLTLILFANICFYNQKMAYLFWIISALGIVLTIISVIAHNRLVLRKKTFPLWIIVIYSMFILYQMIALRAGDFNWDTLIWRAVESLCIYAVIVNDLRMGRKFDWPFIVSGFLAIIMVLRNELEVILSGYLRIGTTLSGNENTVGFAFGIISLVIMWTCCQEGLNNNKIKMIFFIVFTAFMLVSGSKKTIVFLAANILIYFYYNRNRLTGWIKVLLIVSVILYVIFGVEYFYNIIGYRIIDAVETLILGKNVSKNVYSYSTDVRYDMIIEAFRLFKEYPILGGGYNYFAQKTVYGYGYSHCNYTELLCSFGIIGTILFYSRHIYQLKFSIKAWLFHKKYSQDIMLLGIVLTVLILITEIGAVTFSAQSLWYLPITISAACYDYLHETECMYK